MGGGLRVLKRGKRYAYCQAGQDRLVPCPLRDGQVVRLRSWPEGCGRFVYVEADDGGLYWVDARSLRRR